jgi:RNA-binding protein YhbY
MATYIKWLNRKKQMKINVLDKKDFKDLSSASDCDINCIHIKISDFKPIIQEFQEHITNTSWINDLDELSKITFRTNADKTINKIINDIITKVTTNLTVDIGEYIVSYSAQHALETNFSHVKIPLAELLKEKISGNPGFDFHSISSSKYLIFGEAKFSLEGTPRAKALDQIGDFINDRDNAELLWLRPFLEDETITHLTNGHKGYTAAFSFNGENILTIFNNALDSEVVNEIIKHKELYLIAVEIC